MTCILSCSHGVVIATAMVFSSTALFLAISRQFSSGTQTSDQQILLRSCLSSEKKKQRKKKKKVKFAENVREPKGNGEEYRKKMEQHLKRIVPEQMIKPEKPVSVCRNDMPANRIALYNGILRDRAHRVQCSY
ncbi:PREDICTED: uncharacterized protein LOC104742758 isoform X2 [Camelina sativa]|uniref:Uncharacterized protein LOC104742758 isoform X2 n=1 Tax=Camelina sativa TaxID=90675 RepID=A0ABM0VWI4_CAMSA|nr:PREDICTED: uncharacterized protein LOC104742758 isoform X2 [Camelina sativa]